MSSSSSVPPHNQLAILDDYQSLAIPIFAHLSPRIPTFSFPATLDQRDKEQRSLLVKQLQPYVAISSMRERTPFPADLLEELPNLKLLMTTGMRNLAIDLAACKKRGIVVTGTSGKPKEQNKGTGEVHKKDDAYPAPSTKPSSTTQHTWALILALARNIPTDDFNVKKPSNGGWQTGFAVDLSGKTLGILGLGKLGAETARIGYLGFGMRVLAWSPNLTQEKADQTAEKSGVPAGAFMVAGSKEELVREADVLSVHLVLSERSQGIIGAKELGMLKEDAMLINTSRGPLVDEAPLLEVLKDGKIMGAGIDVFETEPLQEGSEWRSLKWGSGGRSRVVLSPHMGYGEKERLQRWYEEQAEILEKWLDGEEVLNKMN